jgi:hypothetical protein
LGMVNYGGRSTKRATSSKISPSAMMPKFRKNRPTA